MKNTLFLTYFSYVHINIFWIHQNFVVDVSSYKRINGKEYINRRLDLLFYDEDGSYSYIYKFGIFSLYFMQFPLIFAIYWKYLRHLPCAHIIEPMNLLTRTCIICLLWIWGYKNWSLIKYLRSLMLNSQYMGKYWIVYYVVEI